MFATLMKYEFRNLKLPFIAPAIVNVGLFIFLIFLSLFQSELLFNIGLAIFSIVNQVLFGIIVIYLIYECYDSLYGSRGAFTHTIPVSTTKVYYAKLVSAMLCIASTLAVINVGNLMATGFARIEPPTVITMGIYNAIFIVAIAVFAIVEMLFIIALMGAKRMAVHPSLSFIIYYSLVHGILSTVIAIIGTALIPVFINVGINTRPVLQLGNDLPIMTLYEYVTNDSMSTFIAMLDMHPGTLFNVSIPIGMFPPFMVLTVFYLWFTPRYMRKHTNV